MNNAFSLKEKIKNKEVVIGMFTKFNNMTATELIGNAGFDFIIVDMEHANFSFYDLENIIRVADGCGMSSVVRTCYATKEDVLHSLDSGADGVQIPSLSTIEKAKEICMGTKYFPEGDRGASTTQRSSKYGCWDKEEPYFAFANRNSTVIVHVENKEMAANIEELCEIPQVDVVFIGPADLSQSLGKPGQLNDPEVVAVIEDVIERTLKAGKAVGIYVGTIAAAKKYVGLGVTYLAYGTDTVSTGLMFKGLKKEIEQELGLK